jgi:hypothetical protein
MQWREIVEVALDLNGLFQALEKEERRIGMRFVLYSRRVSTLSDGFYRTL